MVAHHPQIEISELKRQWKLVQHLRVCVCVCGGVILL